MLKLMSLLAALLLALPMVAVCAGGQVNVFIYHRFGESRYPSTNISPEIFRQQLTYLKEHQVPVLAAGEIVRRLRAKEALPERAVALMVDDAYRSFAEVAMPIVREFGFPISLFVNTDAVGSRNYLDWNQIKALQAEGVEIGNHTASHPYLVEMEPGETFSAWRQRVKTDIQRAQQAFRTHLGRTPELFVYPYGEYSPELVELVKQLGFSAAFAQQSGVIYSGSDLFALPRFPMGGAFATLDGFVAKLQMRPMLVLQEEPYSPVIGINPPLLMLQIDAAQIDLRRVNCFVQGENRCWVEKVQERPGWYRVLAKQPLSGRRNKYTLTAPGRRGDWHWYSHLWINAKQPVGQPEPVAARSAAGAQVDVGEAGEPVAADQ